MKSLVMLCGLALGCFSATLMAAEPAKPDAPQVDPARVVGSVYGKPITAGDIGLQTPIDVSVKFDSRDEARWELMGRITLKFGQPVVARFIAERKAEPTAEEL